MRRFVWLTLLAAVALPFTACGETYTCVSFEYPPLIHQAAGTRPEGLAVEIVDHVFRQIGENMRVKIFPWARALAMMKQGEADCIFTLYHAPERDVFLDYSNEPVIPQLVYLYTRAGNDIAFDGDIASLQGFRFGTAYKINYGPKFEQLRDRLHIDEAPTIEQNFMKLGLGRVDVVPSNVYTLALPSMQGYADHIVRLPTLVESVMSYIAFPKTRNLCALRDRFDAEMRKFAQSPAYRQLLDRYNIERPPEFAWPTRTEKKAIASRR